MYRQARRAQERADIPQLVSSPHYVEMDGAIVLERPTERGVVRQQVADWIGHISEWRVRVDDDGQADPLLGKQLAMLERRLTQPSRLTRVEKLSLMVILLRLRATSRRTLRQLSLSIRIVKPETILRWHCELVRWKWMRGARRKAGRPRTPDIIERLSCSWRRRPAYGAMVRFRASCSNSVIVCARGQLLRYGAPNRKRDKQVVTSRHFRRNHKRLLPRYGVNPRGYYFLTLRADVIPRLRRNLAKSTTP